MDSPPSSQVPSKPASDHVARIGVRARAVFDAARRTALAASARNRSFSIDIAALTAELFWQCDQLRGDLKLMRSRASQEPDDGTPTSDSTRPADLHGKVSAFPADQVLAFLETTRATGFLTFQDASLATAFGIESGRVVHAVSTDLEPEARLGALLVESGSISPDDLATALATCSASGKRIGEHLVDSGTVDVSTLRRALDRQVRLILRQAMQMRGAHFSFYRHVKSQVRYRVACVTTELLLDAARLSDEDVATSPDTCPTT